MTLRELFWAVESERRRQWADWSIALAYILNAMPNMSSRARPPIHPDRINPFIAHAPSAIPLKRGSPEASAALERWASRAAHNR
jgi:hypothetical protein